MVTTLTEQSQLESLSKINDVQTHEPDHRNSLLKTHSFYTTKKNKQLFHSTPIIKQLCGHDFLFFEKQKEVIYIYIKPCDWDSVQLSFVSNQTAFDTTT